jgi:hypothetical protein
LTKSAGLWADAGCTWWLETRWELPHDAAERLRGYPRYFWILIRDGAFVTLLAFAFRDKEEVEIPAAQVVQLDRSRTAEVAL